ncbi:MAG: hypothetical protein U9N32_06770 [Spirochaetota bacterium]|nr:hypothetical protein [Spirochaetota bacterium]
MLSNPRGLRGMSSIMTMKAWTKKLNSSEEIPEVFKDHFYQRNKNFPYTVYIPANSTLLKKRNEKLLSLYDDSLTVLENTKDEVIEIKCSFDKISYIEKESILMLGSVKIYGETPVSLYFNTMGDKIFNTIITAIRTYLSKNKKNALKNNNATELLELLRKSNLKYLNSILELIQDKETVHSVLFQPEVRKKVAQKRGEKTILKYLASHVTVLTSSEIIHIREEKSRSFSKKTSYGTVSLIIPLEKVNKVELRKDEKEMKRLIVGIEGTHNLEFHYDMVNEKVEDFASMCSAFIKG